MIVVLVVALATQGNSTSGPIGSTVGATGSFAPDDGHVVYSSTFAPGDGWDTGAINDNTVVTLTNGRYVVQGSTDFHHALLTPYVTGHAAMSVEASVTDYSTTDVSFGAGCQSTTGLDPALVFQVMVYPDGRWFLEEARIPGSVTILRSGNTAPLGTTTSVQMTCAVSDPGASSPTVQLVAFVNGLRVGAVGQSVGQIHVGGYMPILVLGTHGPTVSATFTHMTVRSLDPSP